MSQLYCSPLVFFFVPAQLPLPLLPLRGSAPLQGGLACLSPVCWSTLWFGWRGLAATFSSVPVRCFSLLQVHCFFWASPAPLAYWGGCCVAPCVRVFQLRCCLLGLQVGFPCCLFLILGGCTSGYGVSRVCGLRRRFRLPFVVLHPLPVSDGPSPFSGVGVVFGHALVAPPATPGFGLF